MISAVSKDFHVMWGTGSPAVAIEHCHNPHTRPDALVLDMALGGKITGADVCRRIVAGAAGRAACSRTCTAWPTSWESPAARRCWTHAPDTICSARLSDRLGLRHAGHPVIAASCAVLYVAVLAEYVFSMAARVPGTATVRDIMLALAVLAGLVGGMFRPDGSCGRRLSRA